MVNLIEKELKFPTSITGAVIKRYKETFAISRKSRSGENREFSDSKLISNLRKYLDKNPNVSVRKMAANFSISKSQNVDKIRFTMD